MAMAFGALDIGTLKPAAPGAFKTPAGPGGLGFGESLGKLIDGVEETQGAANEAVTAMVNKTGEVHDAMIALQRAQMQLELTVTIRNKMMTAYQEIMRMSV